MPAITAPDPESARLAAARLAGLATPPGALGRLGEVAVWFAATQGQVPPPALADVRLVIFAGDHGVARHGVSAFPPEITAAMVRTFVAGKAGVNALASTHGVQVRVLDLGVDDDLAGVPESVQAHKVRRSSGAIHLEDALTAEQTVAALEAGRQVAREEMAAGAAAADQRRHGHRQHHPRRRAGAAALGLPASEVTGRGTGIDDAALSHKEQVVQQALDRAGDRVEDPIETLTALSSADLAATTGFLLEAAESGVPVLLDGLMSVACALTADRIAPGAAAWFAAGHRSTEPAQSLALAKMGLEPLLDLGLRLGEGSGAVAAVPVLRSAVALLRDVALLSELLPDA